MASANPFGQPPSAWFRNSAPKEATTLNAIAGIGMLAVGILGGPVIGKMTEDSIRASVEEATSEETYASISNESTYFLGDYTPVDPEKVKALPEDKAKTINDSIQSGKQGSPSQRGKIPCLHAHMLPSIDRLLSAKRVATSQLKFNSLLNSLLQKKAIFIGIWPFFREAFPPKKNHSPPIST